MLFQNFKKNADVPALISTDRIIRYRECDRIAAGTAQQLKEVGVKQGDRVAIVSRNCLEYPVLLMALFRIGAIAVLVNYRFPPHQIDTILGNNSCRYGINSKEYSKKEKSNEIRWHDMDGLVPREMAEGTATAYSKMSPDQDATIIFTSGTCGEPKAALHTLGNHNFSALGSNQNIPFDQNDRWLLSLPLYHVGGLAILFRALINGGSVVIPEDDISLAHSIVKYQPTHLSLVATQLYRLLSEHRAMEQIKKMKVILLGGSSIPSNLIEKSLEYQLPVYTSYGSTEMASQITTTRSDDSPERLLTSGVLLPYRQLKIAADGEILVKGKTLFKGYVQHDKIISALDEKGWFATGDLGRLDSDGYLTVIGRKDNMFISGGENIQPEEIERELCAIEGVKDAIVVPVQDKEFGERPFAFIDMPGTFPEQTFFRNYLAERIASFKIPDYFSRMLPNQKPMGVKIDRMKLKKLAKEIMLQQS